MTVSKSFVTTVVEKRRFSYNQRLVRATFDVRQRYIVSFVNPCICSFVLCISKGLNVFTLTDS